MSGAPDMSSCTRCSGPLDSSHRFCPSCGAPVTDSSALPTAASPSPASDKRSSADTGRTSAARISSQVSSQEGRFAPGNVLVERYQIIGLLGKGGMGEVYRADDLRLGLPVALKFLSGETAKDPDRLGRFYNEVRIAREISHPSVCRVHDIGDVEGQPFLNKHSSIPTRKSHVFTTVFDNQQWVDLHLLQGESDKAEFNTSLGKYKLTDIPPGPKGVPQFEVAFEIDINGITVVSAKDQATDRDQNVVVGGASGLSKAEVERLQKQFDASRADESKVEKELLRVEVQMLMLSVRHALATLTSVLNTGEQEDIGRTLDDAQKALDDDPDRLEPTFTRLLAAAETLSEARQGR